MASHYPPPPLEGNALASATEQVLLPQLLEPCPTLPFRNTPPCQSNGRRRFRYIWCCSHKGREGG